MAHAALRNKQKENSVLPNNGTCQNIIKVMPVVAWSRTCDKNGNSKYEKANCAFSHLKISAKKFVYIHYCEENIGGPDTTQLEQQK